MSWVKLDDHLADHPKIVEVGTVGLAIQIRALCYCARYLTDGFLTESVGNLLANPTDVKGPDLVFTLDDRPWIERMVGSGLWEKVPGGYQIHDYLKYNPPRKQVLESREKDLKRKQNSKVDSGRIPPGIQKESSGPVPVPQMNHVLSSVPVPLSKGVVGTGSGNKVLLQGPALKFWDAYPIRGRERSGKKRVADAWKDLKPDEAMTAAIKKGLEIAKRSKDWTKESGQFVPAAHRWLKNRQWEGLDTPPDPLDKWRRDNDKMM